MNKAIIITMFLLAMAVPGLAEPVSIEMQPEHVGVFYTNKTQQFTAICIDGDGTRYDCTEEVDCYIIENPLEAQIMEGLSAEDTALIDPDTCLATLKSSWGRVTISACWPKGCYIPLPPPKSKTITALYPLIFKDKE